MNPEYPFFVKLQMVGIAIIAWLSICTTCFCAEPCYLVTYGNQAGTIEGDDDFVKVIFIKIPKSQTQPLYIRIFDPDCGGILDARYGRKWNTVTSFRVFGGQGAFTNPGLEKPTPDKTDLSSGKLLVGLKFDENPIYDNKWYLLTPIQPEEGEPVDQHRYFKLVVEGIEGDDGNRYLIDVSADPNGDHQYPGLQMFTYAATVHLSRSGVFAEMRFFAPKNISEIHIHNFDLAGAVARLDTAFRTSLPMRSSGQNQWVKNTIRLDQKETGRLCAIRFEGGEEMPNDASFYVTDSNGNILPISIPIFLWKPNSRPEPHIVTQFQEDCFTVTLDASGTKDPDQDELKFFWNFGDDTTGEGMKVSHRYPSPGIYNGYLIVEDSSGHVSNSAMKSFSVTINDAPVANAGNDRTVAPGEIVIFNASESFDRDGKIIKYFWNFGDNQTVFGAIVKHSFDHPGKYQVLLQVEDDSKSPCSISEDTCEIIVNESPVPVIDVEMPDNRPTLSVGEIVRLSAKKSYDPDGNIIQYHWNLGDGTEEHKDMIDHRYKAPGKYTVTLTVTDNSGVSNQSSSLKKELIVNAQPIANAGKDQKGSVKEPIIFDGSGSYDPDGTLVEFFWDFGDGTNRKITCQPKDISCMRTEHVYQQPGIYTVVLSVKDNSGASSDTTKDQATVTINDPPIANAGEDQWVTDSEVKFDGTASKDPDGQIIRFDWNFGDGKTGSGPTPTHVYRNPGKYVVRLTVTDDSETSSNTSSDEMIVTINQVPVADAGPDKIGVPGKPIHFDGSASIDPDGTIIAWNWDFGDGNRSDGVRTSHIYKTPGVYTVQLKVFDNSGHQKAIGMDSAIVTINAPPVAIGGTHVIVAPGDKVTFDGSKSYDPDGKIESYRWEFSDGKSWDSPIVQRSFDHPGMYAAVLMVTDNQKIENSSAHTVLTVRVNHPPVAVAGRDIYTSNKTIIFDGSGSTDADGDPLIHKWYFGDGSEAIGEKVSHTYAKGGIYPVILLVDDTRKLKNSVSKNSITVKINEPPKASAGGNKIACAGKIILFDASGSKDPEGGVMKYDWDFGDGTFAQGLNPVKIYDTGGVYPVTLTVTDDSGIDGGNTSTDQIVVKVIESPVANAGPDQTVCAGAPVQFDGTQSKDIDGLVNSYRWDFGDGETGGGPTPIHIYSKAGIYTVRLTITGDRTDICDNIDSDEMMVTVEKAPVSDFISPQEGELGKSIMFEAIKDDTSPINIIKWDWDFGDGSFGQGKEVSHVFSKPGRFIVTLIVTADSETECNKTSLQKSIRINAPPIAKAGTDLMTHLLVGVNEWVVFDAQLSRDPDGAITSYRWNFGDGTTGEGVQIRHKYQHPGQYAVELNVTDDTSLGNNTGADTMLVTVNAPPKPVISVKDQVCPGEVINISAKESTDADGEIVDYMWSFGDGSPKKSGPEVQHVYRQPGLYVLLLEVDDGRSVSNSKVQISKMITVNSPPVADAGHDQLISPGEDILLDASSSYDKDGKIIRYQWDFGDGTGTEGQKTSHRYQSPGVYTLQLTIQDDSQTSCNTSTDSAVIRVNSPPVAKAGGDHEGYCGGVHDAIVFDGSESFDPDGDPLRFFWDFGDGSSATGVQTRHVYYQPGEYRVTLKVDDGTRTKSAVSLSTVTVRIRKR